MTNNQADHYWGPVTSSVDWCEENYLYSVYIAEFWNTISSFAMVIFGCLGACLHWKSLGWKLSTGYLFVVIVGIGSILFHGTLQFQYQMWDEVPMIWTACYLFWLLLEEHGYKHTFYAVMMISYCLLATFLTSQSKGSLQFYLFQASFGLAMWSCFWFVWQMYRRIKRKDIKSIFHQGAYYLIGAISVWLFDKNFCFVYKWIPNPQFHAWWHILMCISLHYFFVGAGHEMVKTKAEIRYLRNIIPYIKVVHRKDE